MAQLYPQAPNTHFSRLLRHAWATVGLFFSPVTTRGNFTFSLSGEGKFSDDVLHSLSCFLYLSCCQT
jgi:hypothetical protein